MLLAKADSFEAVLCVSKSTWSVQIPLILQLLFPGTGAFIPQPFAASKPIGRYIAPALRANNENTWRSCNPLAGKDLNNAVTMCHVLASKVQSNIKDRR